MKKINILLILICSFFVINFNLEAKCNDKELNSIVNKKNLKYYDDEDIYDKDNNLVHEKKNLYYLMFDNSFSKLKDKLIIKVHEDYTGRDIIAEYDDYLKNYIIGSYVHFESKKYDIKVYGSEKSACPNELLLSFSHTQNKYNEYQQSQFCSDNPKEDICKSNYDTTDITKEEYIEKTKEIEKKKNETLFDKIMNIIAEYWYFVVIPVALILIYFYFRIKAVKKEVTKE